MTRSTRPSARSERTRAAILEAAEVLFAERGFAGARLEDVAERVGIRRASLFYYFKDKQAVYDAVLAGVFGDLYTCIEAALSSRAPLAERIEAGVTAWVDYVGGRPTTARLLLREAADATPGRRPALLAHTPPFIELIRREVFAREDLKNSGLNPMDPVHMASAIAGSTVFLVAAMPTLLPDWGLDPVSPEHVNAHRTEVLRIVRRLLGTRGPRAALPQPSPQPTRVS